MKYNGIIQRKLALLDEQVQKIRQHTEGVSFEEFRDSWALRSMSERAVQVAAEIVIDIAERIISLKHAGPVASSAKAIDRLVDLGVLSSSDPYRSIVRFRNLIVHEYEEVDPKLLYSIITEHLEDFYSFRDELDRA